MIYREVFLLRDVEELSIGEAAESAQPLLKCGYIAPESCCRCASATSAAGPKTEEIPVVIDCKHVWDRISDFLDDTLSPDARDLVLRHLEHCEICSAILDSKRNIIILTADARVFELPMGYGERLHARLEEEISVLRREPC